MRFGPARRLGAAVVLIAALVSLAASPADDAAYPAARDASPTALQERRLVQGLIDVRQGRLDRALDNLTGLVRHQPDFGLAQLVYGDLLLASSGRLAGFGNHHAENVLAEYREEARARIGRYLSAPPVNSRPDNLLRLPQDRRAAIVVDLDRNRLFLFENRERGLVRTRDFYVSIGKAGADKQREGDEKTPVGVYRVSDFLPDSRLPDMYGDGAFPIDYPNGWDRRRGRSGSGIWIHGTESARYSRPPLSSEGCVTLSNEDFRILKDRIAVGETPVVVVAGGLRWVPERELEEPASTVEQALERWRRDWESLDTGRYLEHYAADFSAGGMEREAFAAHKRRVNRSKSWVKVEVDDLEIFRYPGEEDLVLVSFVQRYRSDNFRATRGKRQYWRHEGDAWRIVLEEAG